MAEEMKVAVEVVEASDLLAKDGQGSSNPYVEVELAGQRQRTTTVFNSLNPSWLQTLVFSIPDPSSLSDLFLFVFHDPHPSSTSTRRHHCLGHLRLSAASFSPSPSSAPLLRFPLDKRSFFSSVRGDLSLRLYFLPAGAGAATAVGDGHIPQEKKEKKEKETVRVFHSIPTESADQAKKAPASAPAKMTFNAVQSAPPPPPTVILPMPARPPQSEYALIPTTPPIAGRLGYRVAKDKISTTYDLVVQMQFLYVNVVKARDLPNMDITGSLDPYVEVKLGNYKGVTKHFEKNQNPIFRQIFAFPRDRLQADRVEVTVKDKDTIKDDFVGKIHFDLTDVPVRVPPDSPLAPQWYRLEDKKGEKLKHGELMLAVWIGTQADEAFPESWHSDAHSISLDGLANTRSKVYFSPKLSYLRVHVIEAQDLIPSDKSRTSDPFVKLQLGTQLRRTRPSPIRSTNPTWNEELMFVAADPFDEPLILSVEDHIAPGKDETLGRLTIPVLGLPQRLDASRPIPAKWYNLLDPSADLDDDKKKSRKFSSKIHLRVFVDSAYHVLDESAHYSSDLRPASKLLRKPSIGLLELGILDARNLAATNAYCIAKYGPKWVRTRTILNSQSPLWHEQYTWEVFDPCTVITIGVFDNNHVSNAKSDAKDNKIGKVRIRLSTLEADRVYTHYYPLLILQTSGLKKTGELHLAIRFTCTNFANMISLYGKPLLPKMHYTMPISVLHLDHLRHQAMINVALRLGRAEPPLRREVVEYMLDVDSHMFSLRRSKANFSRITSVLSSFGAVVRWFDAVCKWKNPVTTILVHVLFFILVCFPELILPTVFLYLSIIGLWNYRFRPRHPPHMDTKLSYAEFTNSDELDEEFDTFPSTKSSDIVRYRYDRLRSVAGRVQTVIGDLATQGERAQAILNWRDPRATAIFIMLSLIIAVFLYVTPFQVVMVIVGLYLLRHPKFRSKMPSVPFNFYRRLPAKSDMLL
ncbi:putative C2 domain, phosphoribosyltransferase, C2 domain superfamily [Dioscorea sansibarensis]